MITSSRRKIRRDYAPLSVSVVLSCTSEDSPLRQTFNGDTLEYEPDRELSPVVITPIIEAGAKDGSWDAGRTASQLGSIHWYANGSDIASLSAFAGKYAISPTGAITIRKNLSASEVYSLHFEAQLFDDRLNVSLPIKTDAVVLSTIDKAEDGCCLSTDSDTEIQYDPLSDKLQAYEYKCAHGIAAAPNEEAAAKDGNEYLRTIRLSFYRGGRKMLSGYLVRLFKIGADLSEVEVSEDDHEVASLSNSKIELDMRLVSKENYVAAAYVDGREKARLPFSAVRLNRAFGCAIANETALVKGQRKHINKLLIKRKGARIDCPEAAIRIAWRTASAARGEVRHNEGARAEIRLSRAGVGESNLPAAFELWAEAEQKAPYCAATDGGALLTDENGKILIFN